MIPPRSAIRFGLFPSSFSAKPLVPAVLVLLLGVVASVYSATNTVTSLADSGAGSLRQVIADSAIDDAVVFGVTGTIPLSSGELMVAKNLSIFGPGQNALTITANGSSRIFRLSPGVTALISDIAMKGGHARDGTNGVFGEYSSSPGEAGEPGGAILSAGTLVLRNCALVGNGSGNGGNGASVPSPPYGSPSAGGPGGAGGAIFSSGALTISNCLLQGNHTGNGGTSGSSTWSPGSGAGGDGGAIYCTGALAMDSSSVSGNVTGDGGYLPIGGAGARAGFGGGVWCSGVFSAKRCSFTGNSSGIGGGGGAGKPNGGTGGSGGYGGGLCCSGELFLTNCTISNNSCGAGGQGGGASISGGGSGGSGGSGGGIYTTADFVLAGCTISGNRTGSGGGGGSSPVGSGSGGSGGNGGGLFNLGNLLATNCTFSTNICGSGGGPGTSGNFQGVGGNGGSGGAAYLGSTNQVLVACTIVSNAAGRGGWAPTFPGADGSGGGVAGVDSEFLNSLVALNVGQGADTSGNFVSLGGNLIGVTNGGTGFTAPGDLTGSSSAPIDPQIGPLADNGGPTLTMALMPGSPAINAGRASGGSSTDQRGTPRPQGTGPDIGAFEYQFAVPVITSARFQSASRFWLQSCGLPEHGYILQVSTNLATWRDVTNLTANVYGVCEAVDTNVVNAEMRFYRLNTPGP